MDSQFIHNGLGNPLFTAGSIFGISRLFGGGKKDAKRRDEKRKALEQLGFVWIPTSGVPSGQEWNIDNWPDISLDNIWEAYQDHGGIVADLHNRQMFYPENTRTLSSIREIVKDHQSDYIPNSDDRDTSEDQPSSTDSGYVNTSPDNVNPDPQQAGYGSSIPDWAIATGILAVGGTLFLLTIKN